MVIEGADYFVRVVDLPPSVNGACTPNDDGTYSVYINGRNSAQKQKKSLAHEVKHITGEDFYNGKCIEDIESLGGD